MLLVGSDFSWEGIGQVMHLDTTIPTAIAVMTAAAVALDAWKQSGSALKLVVNGFNRLFLKDVERESRAEAGAFLAAYMTGLPSFAFQPSAVEALRCELLRFVLLDSSYRWVCTGRKSFDLAGGSRLT